MKRHLRKNVMHIFVLCASLILSQPVFGDQSVCRAQEEALAVYESCPEAEAEGEEGVGADICTDEREGSEAADREEAAGSDFSTGESEDADVVDGKMLAEADSYEEAVEIAAGYGAVLESYSFGIAVLTVSGDSASSELISGSCEEGRVPLYPDYRYEIFAADDPYLSPESDHYQWMHDEAFLNTRKAWEYTKGDGITVAVLDTGVSKMDEFGDRLLSGVNVTDGTENTADTIGHGTHVAGIIAASAGDGTGGAGVAPGVKIYPVKCTDAAGGITSEHVARAVNAAIARNVDVINFSAGGANGTSLEAKSWKKAIDSGIVVVAAAGNNVTNEYAFPAAFPGVISVAALDQDNTLAAYSNYGADLDIAAPGTGIWSLGPRFSKLYLELKSEGKASGDYMCMDGTSMAAPTVAGTAALILSVAPSLRGKGKLTPKLVRDLIRASAADETYYLDSYNKGAGSMNDASMVYGGLDAYNCVLMAMNEEGLEKPVIKVSDSHGKRMVTIDGFLKGGEVYYTLDGSAPDINNSALYEAPFELKASGKVTIKAVYVLGKKKSRIASYKAVVSASAAAISVNNGNPVYITAGKKVRLPLTVSPDNVLPEQLEYKLVSGTGFTVDDKGYVTCDEGTSPGTKAEILVRAEPGVETVAKLIAKDTMTNVITVRDSLQLVAVENEGTKAAGLTGLYDLSEDIRLNDKSTGYEIKSSKSSVVKVVNNRYLKAVSKGNALITVTATDGSGKKAKCKVKVLMPTLSIDALKTSTGFLKASSVRNGSILNMHFAQDTNIENVTGPVPIAKNGRIKLFAYTNGDMRWKGKAAPAKRTVPSNKKMVYTVSGPGAAGISIKNGIVYCPAGAVTGSLFTVTVSSADGFGARESLDFKVYNDPGALSFDYEEYTVKPEASFYETSFYFNGKNYSGMLDHLRVSSTGSYPYYDVSVDRNMVARGLLHSTDNEGNAVYFYRYFIRKSGTAAFSYKTKDGSNKKFGFKLSVSK